MDGENVCIFAYGPTGSGKTFTMQGVYNGNTPDLKSCELAGVLPRTAEFIFEELTRQQRLGSNFKLSFAAIEVYNENIYDLLNPKDKTPLQLIFIKNTNVHYL